jgi:hypothetical protein
MLLTGSTEAKGHGSHRRQALRRDRCRCSLLDLYADEAGREARAVVGSSYPISSNGGFRDDRGATSSGRDDMIDRRRDIGVSDREPVVKTAKQ